MVAEHRRLTGHPSDRLVVGAYVGAPRRRQDENGVGPLAARSSGQLHRLVRRRCAGPCQYRDRPHGHRLAHRPDELDTFIAGQRCRFAGRSGHHDGLHTELDHPSGMVGRRLGIQAAVVAEHSDQRHTYAAKYASMAHGQQPYRGSSTVTPTRRLYVGGPRRMQNG